MPATFALPHDIDRDGHLDLLVGYPDETHVLLADGAGGFGDATYPLGATSPGVAVDLDGDRDADFVFAADSSLVLFEHLVGDRFDWTILPMNEPVTRVVHGDLNADGLPDFIDFGPRFFTPVRSVAVGFYAHGTTYEGNLQDPRLVDHDGDGFLDLASGDPVFEVYRGAGEGVFVAPVGVGPLGTGPLLLADVDGDGVRDAVFGEGSGIAVARGTCAGRFTRTQTLPWDRSLTLRALGSGDLDHDGNLDIVAARHGSGISGDLAVIRNGGGGVLQAPVSYAAGVQPTTLVVEDFDGDGNLGLLTNGWVSFAVQLRGRGDATFGPPQFVEAGTPGVMAAGDFDRDGYVDVAAHVDEGVRILTNAGDGSLVASAPLPARASAKFGPVEVEDLDRDGWLDLVVGSDSIEVLRGRAGGGFVPGIGIATGGSVQGLDVADFDADGRAEIVAGIWVVDPPLRYRLRVYREDAPGSYSVALEARVPSATVRAADVTGDGRPDILTRTALYTNRADAITPVWVTDLVAQVAGAEVVLAWSLPVVDAQLAGVDVERAAHAAGPWQRRTARALEPRARMRYVDALPAGVDVSWYRLAARWRNGTQSLGPIVAVKRVETGLPTRLRSVRATAAGDVEIRYDVGAGDGPVRLAVFDVRGRRVAQLAPRNAVAGTHVQVWDARELSERRLARGVYWVRLSTPRVTEARSFLLLHPSPAR